MTFTILPFRETKRVNPSNLHEGPYYGAQLRRLLSPPPRQSIVDRATDYYMGHAWPAVVLMILGAALVAAVIVSCAAVVR